MASGLLIVDGFLTPEECKAVLTKYRAALKARQVKPRGTLTTDLPLREIAKEGFVMCNCGGPVVRVAELRDKLGVLLAEHFGLPKLYADYSAYTRVVVGGAHELHADAVTLEGKPNDTPHRTAAGMVYLSKFNTDFAGGRISFPGVGVTTTPRPGRVVGFPATLRYRHYVEKVTRGERDALAFWFTADATKAETWPPAIAGKKGGRS